MSIHARVKRACGQQLIHNAQIIEYFQGSGLHSLAPGSRERFGGLVDDSKAHPAAGKVAGKRKTRWPGADNDDVRVIRISGRRGHYWLLCTDLAGEIVRNRPPIGRFIEQADIVVRPYQHRRRTGDTVGRRRFSLGR